MVSVGGQRFGVERKTRLSTGVDPEQDQVDTGGHPVDVIELTH